ncbi:pathogenicity island protein [Staphylococcus sp. AOAB]|uniref:type II toxin-antitoxin system toxin TscT n=1 Tax=Staphylococcus pasteuri TaxID=45972 RepID=UPI00086AF8F4|nr:pathogenicity island protein [Staphylococcus sp. AOAB]
MNLEVSNLFSDLEVLKDRFEDLKDSHSWHFDKRYSHETNHILNKDELIRDGLSYHERRIHNDQMIDLLRLYIEQFDNILEKFQEIEKASSDMNSLATTSDNA